MKPLVVAIAQSEQAAVQYLALLPHGEAVTQIFSSVDQFIAADGALPALIIVQAENTASCRLLLRQIVQAEKFQLAPIFVILTSADAAGRAEMLESGASEVVSLPCEVMEIRRRLERVFLCGEREREVIRLQSRINKLSQYFSNDVVEEILSRQEENGAYGENLEATVFFLDVRNFTRISENVEPNLIAALLNRLYTDIMDLVLTYKGSVNKIIGDALLSTFGCPVRGERDARNAVECALAIRDTMKLFNSTRPAYIHEEISIGMGIATGPVFAGTIGSYRKRDYTVIGDTVNIAARLEGLTKQTRFDLIIDRKTRDLAGEGLKVRKLQVSRVRGRTQPMEIFLVDSLLSEAAEQNADTVFFSR